MLNTFKNKIVITTGDSDGIGFEITIKALKAFIGMPVQFFVCRHKSDSPHNLVTDWYDSFNPQPFNSISNAIECAEKPFVDIALTTPAAEWVVQSSKLALINKINALVTGPLSKDQMLRDGYPQVGHTGIFRELTHFPLFMTFLGSKLNTVLITDHIAISDVEKTLNTKSIKQAIELSLKLHKQLQWTKPIALLGLNPHNGEKGIIGSFENKVLQPLLDTYFDNDSIHSQPIVPDVAFMPEQIEKYSLYISLYHDQGLIPFKLLHGQNSGCQLTLGLPFVRTSVDHGTAKDLFNKGMANSNSMEDSIRWALRLLNLK